MNDSYVYQFITVYSLGSGLLDYWCTGTVLPEALPAATNDSYGASGS